MRIRKTNKNRLGSFGSSIAESIKKFLPQSVDEEKAEKDKVVLCPYCLEPFELRKVCFRVKSDNLEESGFFAATPDEALQKQWSNAAEGDRSIREFSWGYGEIPKNLQNEKGIAGHGTVITGAKNCILRPEDVTLNDDNDGFPGRATDTRGVETDIRVCPHCHCILPQFYGARRILFFAVVGIMGSGKTVFLSKFFETASDTLKKAGITFSGSDSVTHFITTKRVTPGQKIPDHTPPEGNTPPIFMPISKTDGNKIEYIDCVFFDIAGENCKTADKIAKMGKHIKHASGVIMLIDPENQLPDAVSIDGKPIRSDAKIDLKTVFSAMTSAYIINENQRNKSDISVAVTISKSDKLASVKFKNEKSFSKTSLVFKDIEYKENGFMDAQAENVNADIRQVIGATLPALVSDFYENSRYFAVSALGAEPIEKIEETPEEQKEEKVYIAPDAEPKRIEEPFLWILSELGIIKKYKHL